MSVPEDDPELAAIRRRLLADLARPPPAAPPAPPADAGRVLEITDAGFEAAVAAHPRLVVDCWAPWCGPCRLVAPVVEALAREQAGRVMFAKLNVDENPRTAQRFQVASIPTMLYFASGRLAHRTVGALPKPQLAAAVEQAFRPRPGPGPRRGFDR